MSKRIIQKVTFEQRYAFLSESNRIEGIFDAVSDSQIVGFETFLQLKEVRVEDIELLVKWFQSDAELRSRERLDVVVAGDYYPPLGGPYVVSVLKQLLQKVCIYNYEPHNIHIEYEKLHPFTDGNGRTGRMLWAWQMIRLEGAGLNNGFLHEFYYQTLRAHT